MLSVCQAGLVECSGMSMVGLKEEFADHPDPRTQHFDVLRPVERPKHNYARDPIEPLDARPLVFEMKRPAIRPASSNGSPESSASFDIVDCLDDPEFEAVDQAIKDKLRSLDRSQRNVIRDLLISGVGIQPRADVHSQLQHGDISHGDCCERQGSVHVYVQICL